MTPIHFGTDGWRAVISDGFTFENLRKVAQAYCDIVLTEPRAKNGIVVGYDTRFLSNVYAQEVAAVAAANGLAVYLTQQATPTPAVSWAVVELEAAGAVMITASHNPPIYNGFKIKAWYGGSAPTELTERVEAALEANQVAGRAPKVADFDRALATKQVRMIDAKPSYLSQLRKLVQFDLIRRSPFKVVVDPMHGAGSGYLQPLLAELGLGVVEIRSEPNPGFGGVNPEPIPQNLGPLFEVMRQGAFDAGLVTDGDADRIGAVDGHGRYVDSQRIFALLLRHLVEDRGWRGSVVKTFAVTQMVDLLGQRYGLTVHKRPVGFKYVCEMALKEDVLIGGEESGGIGVKNHLPERDGLLCNLLLLEMMAQRGKTLAGLVDELLADLGYHTYQRLDLHLTPTRKERLQSELTQRPPAMIGGLPVTAVDSLDGHKFFLANHGWILFRASGTEPIVRVYAELDDDQRLQKVLAGGRALALGEQ